LEAMRALPLVTILAVSSPVYAGGFAEPGGGGMIPRADSGWTNYVEPTPKGVVRARAVRHTRRGTVSVDWQPVSTDAQGWSGAGTYQDINAFRFRILANAVAHIKAGAKLTASARLGAGIDIQHVSVKTVVGPFVSDISDTDTGFALEPGGGLWFD